MGERKVGMMPKEIIKSRNDGDLVERIDIPGTYKKISDPYVHVGWAGKDLDHVEIAVLSPETTVDDPTDATATPRQIPDGYWVQLDRVGINRLIRSLRKARDAAFGRDE